MTSPAALSPSLWLGSLAALCLLAACGDDSAGGQDTAEDTQLADTTAPDTAVPDTATTDANDADTAEDATDTDTVAEDTATADDTQGEDTSPSDAQGDDVVSNDLGFTIRYPGTHTVTCQTPFPDEPEQEVAMADADWLCTFAYGASSGWVYVRGSATECYVIMSTTPVFGDCAGWISLAGVVSPVADAAYDWGGNHHNDSIDFTWDGKRFTFDHSSFGFGWRKCQEMDCLVVRDSDGAVIEDGCTVDRTLPTVCRQIASDGTWGSFEDTFAPCPGDPNYR